MQRFALSIQLLPLPGHLVHLIILLHITGGGSERAISSVVGCYNIIVTTSKEKGPTTLGSGVWTLIVLHGLLTGAERVTYTQMAREQGFRV